ncbi:hypothetical protein Dimus_024964 [Dionaea muscipula]
MWDVGSLATTKDDITESITHFYRDLYGTTLASSEHFEDSFLREGNLISDSQQNSMAADFIVDDVKDALWGIGDDKAPRHQHCGDSSDSQGGQSIAG